MITGSTGGLGSAGPEGLDFEGRRWERFFEGKYSEAKEIMARLDSENVPNRMTFPEQQDMPMTVVIEVRHRWLPKARELVAL